MGVPITHPQAEGVVGSRVESRFSASDNRTGTERELPALDSRRTPCWLALQGGGPLFYILCFCTYREALSKSHNCVLGQDF